MKNSTKLLLILALLLSAIILIGCSRDKPAPRQYIEEHIIAQPGDTYWGYAIQYCPDEMEVREYMRILQEINGVERSGDLAVWQEVIILKEVIR